MPHGGPAPCSGRRPCSKGDGDDHPSLGQRSSGRCCRDSLSLVVVPLLIAVAGSILCGSLSDADARSWCFFFLAFYAFLAGLAITGVAAIVTLIVRRWGSRRFAAFASGVAIVVVVAAGAFVATRPPSPMTSIHPSWSPDGAQIAFVASGRDGWGIYVMNADGSNREVVDAGPFVATRLPSQTVTSIHPSWSPDGAQIAFVASGRDGWGIYVMNADGSNREQITDRGGTSPVWSPDGAKIAFASFRDRNLDIYVMNADGSGQTRLTTSCTEHRDW